MNVKLLSHVRCSANPWTAAYQAPPSMGFSRQEHWSGVPLPSPNIIISTIYYWLLKLIINSALENIGISALLLLLRERIEILAKF